MTVKHLEPGFAKHTNCSIDISYFDNSILASLTLCIGAVKVEGFVHKSDCKAGLIQFPYLVPNNHCSFYCVKFKSLLDSTINLYTSPQLSDGTEISYKTSEYWVHAGQFEMTSS